MNKKNCWQYKAVNGMCHTQIKLNVIFSNSAHMKTYRVLMDKRKRVHRWNLALAFKLNVFFFFFLGKR